MQGKTAALFHSIPVGTFRPACTADGAEVFSLFAAREGLNLHSVIIGTAVQPGSLDWRGVCSVAI
jgi:hypothetical protein